MLSADPIGGVTESITKNMKGNEDGRNGSVGRINNYGATGGQLIQCINYVEHNTACKDFSRATQYRNIACRVINSSYFVE